MGIHIDRSLDPGKFPEGGILGETGQMELAPRVDDPTHDHGEGVFHPLLIGTGVKYPIQFQFLGEFEERPGRTEFFRRCGRDRV